MKVYYDKDVKLSKIKKKKNFYYRLWKPGTCSCPELKRQRT